MNDTIYAENKHNFKIGPDFELHTIKRKEIEGKKECFKDTELGANIEGYACKTKGCKNCDENEKNLHALEFMNIGFYLITPLLVGVLLGSYIDSTFHIRPIATIVLLAAGTFAMFYNLFRLIKGN